MVNLNTINISSLDFHIWQHLEKHQNESQFQHLASIPSVPVDQLYRHMINGIHYITPFTSPEESTGDTASIWTLVEAWYSLEQYIGLKEDKLSSTTVDFIRSEGNLETKRLYWFSKPKMC